MRLKRDVGSRLDDQVAGIAERVVRRISRRDALRTSMLGGAGAVAALAIGERPASATTANCYCGPTYRCGYWGHPCPHHGCPSRYRLCKNDGSYCSCAAGHTNVQGYCCEYASGYWVACGGLCGGYGYRLCYDCKWIHCGHWCTCLSALNCCHCTSPEDFHKEQARQQALTVQ
jgi:hypothetical protein